MHVPRKKTNSNSLDLDDGEDALEIDPELRYSFQRNFQFLQRVFSIDTIVKPLPPAMAYNVSRNLSFFTRIFTQFFDPEGIANVQKLLGLGQEEKAYMRAFDEMRKHEMFFKDESRDGVLIVNLYHFACVCTSVDNDFSCRICYSIETNKNSSYICSLSLYSYGTL
ncbi:hypothetical protein K2173_009766 [Erythroxylum novogranatense]|uniref:Uncharacterized protein n=1 Tax=Erythroxylum novogranatense TaxID=1862640 RepID=A0AAV8SZU7_9ROSI|nr:hypothetical protein K2173_009766 [Erythroxylum novogranatense]